MVWEASWKAIRLEVWSRVHLAESWGGLDRSSWQWGSEERGSPHSSLLQLTHHPRGH